MKKYLQHIGIFILLSVSAFSCTKYIDIDLPPYEEKVVVDGWIETNQPAHVFLTRSSAYFTNYDSSSIRDLFINTAKITIECSDGNSEILTLYRKEQFFPPFVYKSISMRGDENKSYKLIITVDGDTITANTSIPAKPNIEQMQMELISDTTTIIKAEVNDNAETKDFYYSEILVRNFDTQYHPSQAPLFSDAKLNGESITHQIDRSIQPDPLNIFDIDEDRDLPGKEYWYKDTVQVKISNIDAKSHEVLQGFYIDNFNTGNPFALVDQKTITNINGGIGRWTGKATRTYLMYLDIPDKK